MGVDRIPLEAARRRVRQASPSAVDPGAARPLPPPSQDLSKKKLELLRAMLREEGGGAATGVQPRPAGTPAPLSFAQERVWFFERMAPGSPLVPLRALNT